MHFYMFINYYFFDILYCLHIINNDDIIYIELKREEIHLFFSNMEGEYRCLKLKTKDIAWLLITERLSSFMIKKTN